MMRDQKGTSLVSVIVSFAVLMIVLLFLQISITASGRYAARADEIWEDASAAENNYINDRKVVYSGEGAWRMVALNMQSSAGGEETWGTMKIYDTQKNTEDGEEITIQLYYAKHE